jgi:triphosphoribosyl-dephospho-CoA synthase
MRRAIGCPPAGEADGVNAMPAIARAARFDARGEGRRIAAGAVRSLHAELVLHPKPGLVSARDRGAHADMDAATFMRSIFALRRYFREIAAAGMRGAAFDELRRLGVAAEARMLRATAGVNTHRGAIFCLGLLAAAAGRAVAMGHHRPPDAALRDALESWRNDLIVVAVDDHGPPSHGRLVALRNGAAGARGEAVAGFPGLFQLALPALRTAIALGAAPPAAQMHALFALMAQLEDTNVLYRGGRGALEWLQGEARDFLEGGSVFVDGWLERAERVHRGCCARQLSPGGCADLLGAAWFVHLLQTDA